jgi:hypothetical protein
MSENRRPDDDSGQNLADHLRLAKLGKPVAEQMRQGN